MYYYGYQNYAAGVIGILVLAVALTLDCVVLAAFVLLIGTNLYYERRM